MVLLPRSTWLRVCDNGDDVELAVQAAAAASMRLTVLLFLFEMSSRGGDGVVAEVDVAATTVMM